MNWSGINPVSAGSEEEESGGGGDDVGLGFRGGARAAVNERLVDVGGEESRVGVPVHQRVDLQLGVFKRVRRRVLHLPVDHLSYPGIQTHLEGYLDQFSKKKTEHSRNAVSHAAAN